MTKDLFRLFPEDSDRFPAPATSRLGVARGATDREAETEASSPNCDTGTKALSTSGEAEAEEPSTGWDAETVPKGESSRLPVLPHSWGTWMDGPKRRQS